MDQCNISVKVFFEGTELGCDLAKKDPPSGCELATFAGASNLSHLYSVSFLCRWDILGTSTGL